MKTNWGTGTDMTTGTSRSTIVALLLCLAMPAWGEQYFLYAPQPATSGMKPSGQDGVLVQEIEVKRGDTLYGISRRFTGHGMYFPQILLFNSIKKPSLIYPGNILKVPVSQINTDAPEVNVKEASGSLPKHKGSPLKKSHVKPPVQGSVNPSGTVAPDSEPALEQPANETSKTGTDRSRSGKIKKKRGTASKRNELDGASTVPAPLQASHKSNSQSDTAVGQKLFEAAVKAYRRVDCRTALELLDRYLADNFTSPLAADANLYKAECFLKLSAQ
jgi:LysM repeat protein